MRYRHEPHWRPRRLLRLMQVPRLWQRWLYSDDSLTARLKNVRTGVFRVEVLRQCYARVQLNEARALSMPPCQAALLREVYLYCGNVRMVYARSVVPLGTLTGRQKRLACLGERPLGGFLFACPDMQREELELASFGRGEAMFVRATDGVQVNIDAIWGRRSVFRLSGKPLLVAEIFLPSVVTSGV